VTLVAFIVVAGAGAAAWWMVGRWPPLRTVVGLVALAACVVLARALPSGELTLFGDDALQTTTFLRLWLLSGSAAALLLLLLAETLGRSSRLAPAALVLLAGTAGALSLTDAAGALLLVVATTTLVGVVALSDRSGRPGPESTGILRLPIAVAVLGLLGIGWASVGGLGEQPTTMLAAFTLVGAALILGTGAVPFHLPLARQGEAVARPLLPLVLGWLPAVLAVVVLEWSGARLVPLDPDLGLVRAVVLGLALLTLAAATVAMLLQEDLGHVVAYAGLQGLALGLLGYASIDGSAQASARQVLLLLPLWLAALVGVLLVLETVGGGSDLKALSGWVRRAPVTAVALAIAVAVAIGLPGSAAFAARGSVADVALGPTVGTVALLLVVASVSAWLRLVWEGLRPNGSAWGAAERPNMDAAAAGAGPDRVRRLLAANRIPIAAVLALALAILPLAMSLGFGHLEAAAAGPNPAASVRPVAPTPSPSPTITPESTPSPTPTPPSGFPPTPTPGLSASPAATQTPGPSSPVPTSSIGD
jgi:formate hydrogenlyase subunit 3/multisubunit Na+/H+ antiporter MnhD subunit